MVPAPARIVVAVVDPPPEPPLADALPLREPAERDLLADPFRDLVLERLDPFRDFAPLLDARDDPLEDDFRWFLGAVLPGDERVLA